MTFVVSIPKSDVLNIADERATLRKVSQAYEKITQLEAEPELMCSEVIGFSGCLILSDVNQELPISDFIENEKGWCLTAGSRVAGEMLASLYGGADSLRYARPVWGSYATVYGNTAHNEVMAWNTLPTIEPICYAETPTHILIGNRPLLVALAAAQGVPASVGLSQEYLIEYLLYGYSMTGQMPYEGVYALLADTALVVRNGTVRLKGIPAGLESTLDDKPTLEESASALSESLFHSRERIMKKVQGRDIQLRMSGGKDSRMLLGLMKPNIDSLYCRIFGSPDDADVILAQYLTKAAGTDLEVSSAPLGRGRTIREKTLRNLRASDGIPLSEAHASVYAGALPRTQGDGIMLGQWPLAKGGAASKMRYSGEEMRRVIRRQGADYIRSEHRAPLDAYFDNWIQKTATTSPLDTLYLFSRNFRSMRWMQGLLCMYSRDAQPVYPLSDAEVTAVSDAISIGDKVTQAAYFKALERIWPLAARTPLGASRWPFDVQGKRRSLDLKGYEERTKSVESVKSEINPSCISQRVNRFDALTGATGTEICREIVASANFELLAKILGESFTETIVKWSHGVRTVYHKYSWRLTLSLLWRVYVAEVWLSREWLKY